MRLVKWYIVPASILVIVVLAFASGAFWHTSLHAVPSALSVPRAAPETLFHKAAPLEGDALTEELNALGYLSGYVKAPAAQGVTTYDPAKAFEGLNLYTSGHAPEAYLMAMDGTLLHRWRYPLEQLWPDDEFAPKYFRRVHVFIESGPSKTINPGCGADRQKYVYMPRRYRFLPSSAFHLRSICVTRPAPAGCGGKTLLPPMVGVSRPDDDKAASRTISASSRSLTCRARRLFSGSTPESSGRAPETCR